MHTSSTRLAAFLTVVMASTALAQNSPSGISVAPAPNSATLPSPGQPQPGPQLSQAQLEQLVAPIALYPDPLLAQILMAATYPLEVIEAARWAGSNHLDGQAVAAALQTPELGPQR